jgi:hypothetical protein
MRHAACPRLSCIAPSARSLRPEVPWELSPVRHLACATLRADTLSKQRLEPSKRRGKGWSLRLRGGRQGAMKFRLVANNDLLDFLGYEG